MALKVLRKLPGGTRRGRFTSLIFITCSYFKKDHEIHLRIQLWKKRNPRIRYPQAIIILPGRFVQQKKLNMI